MQRRMSRALRLALAGWTALTLASCGTPDNDGTASAITPGGASLAELRRSEPDAGRLLSGGEDAFKRQISDARGTGVVVNQWASWCGPCRAEFPFLQRLAQRYRGKVTFLGVNARDSSDDARGFLARYPTPFPHIEDPDAKVARLFGGGRGFPTTAFYDSTGKLSFTHQGAYATQAALDADIRRYALK